MPDNADPIARHAIEQHSEVCLERMGRIEKMFDDIWRAIEGLRAKDDDAAKARERARERHLATLRWIAGLLAAALIALIGYIGRGWTT